MSVHRIEAVRLIKNLIDAEVLTMKQINSGRGRISKKAEAEEFKAIRELFAALTGSVMAPEELREVQP